MNTRNQLKISFITTNSVTSGSARQRVYKLVNFFKENNQEISISVNENIENADILVLQKSNPVVLCDYLIKYYQKKFIVFDIDDFHPKGEYDFLIKFSDLLIVGSEYLKAKFLPMNKNIFVLDDPIDVKDLNMQLKPSYNLSKPKLGWFGNTCNLDVLEKTGVKNVTKITRGGDIEWSLDTIDENLQKFDVVLIPQEKSITGLAKGNCRMLKCIYLGIPALVSNLDAYVQLAKLIDYPVDFVIKDGANWNNRIDDIKNNKIKFDFDFKKAREITIQNYGIEAFANQWLNSVLTYYNTDQRNAIGKYSKEFIKQVVLQKILKICYKLKQIIKLVFKKLFFINKPY